MLTGECVTSEMMNSFLSGGLTPAAREAVELHLSHCRQCRVRLVELYTAGREPAETHTVPRGLKKKALRIPGRGRLAAAPWYFGARPYLTPSLAAVFLVVIAVGGLVIWQMRQNVWRPPTGDRLRQVGTIPATPRLLSPVAGTTLSTAEIEFRWTSVPGVRQYNLVLLNEEGDVVSQQPTEQTQITLNASRLSLTVNKNYFWYVEATFPDGTSVETATSKFMLSGG